MRERGSREHTEMARLGTWLSPVYSDVRGGYPDTVFGAASRPRRRRGKTAVFGEPCLLINTGDR